ncbi:MAG: hypothetical protein COB78_10765 [Hyphomicrobiales bacterium]|nr:MAG: hypothetical protein COB78_10765 [Hyphomicrobiales bacterium]
MAKMAIGHDDNGPFIKITSDEFDPRTEPDENYSNFRFNSRYAQVGYFDETRTALYSSGQNTANYQTISGASVGVALSSNGIPIGPLGPFVSSGWNTTSLNSTAILYGMSRYRVHVSGYVFDQGVAPNGKAAYDYPTIADYYLQGSGGWNYPNFWRSVNYTNGGGNEWGSVAYLEMTRRIENPSGYGGYPTGPSSGWVVRPSLLAGLNGFNVKFIITPLPASDSPIQFAEGSPETGQRVISIDNSSIKVARKGFDTRTASDDQLIIGGSTARMPVYMARRLSLSIGQTVNIPLRSWVPGNSVVLMQWNIHGQARRLPSIWVGSTASGTQLEIRWRIANGVLTIQNLAPFSYDVVFLVTSQVQSDPLGGPAIREGIQDGEKYISIVQGNGLIGADSRSSYLAIIKQGTLYGSSGTVTFPNQGYIPFVWYSYCFLRNGFDTFLGPRYITNRYNQVDCISNSATITNTTVSFQSFATNPYLIASPKPYTTVAKYFRYYIFAIPDVQSS